MMQRNDRKPANPISRTFSDPPLRILSGGSISPSIYLSFSTKIIFFQSLVNPRGQKRKGTLPDRTYCRETETRLEQQFNDRRTHGLCGCSPIGRPTR